MNRELQSGEYVQNHSVFLIRHGQNAGRGQTLDLENMNFIIENLDDPQLTDRGINQARETGQYLRKRFKEENILSIKVESSPWLRTLQTASIIIQELGFGYQVQPIQLNYLYSDSINAENYEQNPIGNLLVETKQLEDLQKEYLFGAEVDIEDPLWMLEAATRYPEDKKGTQQRAVMAKEDLIDNYYSSVKTAHIVVTHAQLIKDFTSHCAKTIEKQAPL